jgi:DNA-formamidopyrimidine glycosylase
MAEGPVVHLYSGLLAKVLEGEAAEIEFTDPDLKEAGPSLRGVRVERVEPHGKQFRIHLSDGHIILVHLLMWGSWKIYERGKQPGNTRKQVRLVLRTKEHEVVAYSTPVVKLLTAAELEADPKWGNLGPDPLREDFDPEEFYRRLDKRGKEEIGPVLLDQQVIAGIGNILKNEILYRARVHPKRRVDALSKDETREILRWSVDLCRTWLNKLITEKKDRWIRMYKKDGKPCPECGTKIVRFRQGGRPAFICPKCQKDDTLELFR